MDWNHIKHRDSNNIKEASMEDDYMIVGMTG